jgi:hypothetical protein
MTTTEALDALTAEIPGRSLSAQIWEKRYAEGNGFSFTVAVHPGFDGETCQLFADPDGFEKPVADVLALAKQVAATPNEE